MPWSQYEDKELRECVAVGMPVKRIADKLLKSEANIKRRIYALRLCPVPNVCIDLGSHAAGALSRHKNTILSFHKPRLKKIPCLVRVREPFQIKPFKMYKAQVPDACVDWLPPQFMPPAYSRHYINVMATFNIAPSRVTDHMALDCGVRQLPTGKFTFSHGKWETPLQAYKAHFFGNEVLRHKWQTDQTLTVYRFQLEI